MSPSITSGEFASSAGLGVKARIRRDRSGLIEGRAVSPNAAGRVKRRVPSFVPLGAGQDTKPHSAAVNPNRIRVICG